MAIALSLNQKDYILNCDKELEPAHQTKFFIKPLTAKQNALIQDSMKFRKNEDNTVIDNLGVSTLEVLKYGLVGWENYNDADGNPIKFLKDMDENISRIALEHRYEISAAIMELSNLGSDKEKN